MTQRYQRIFASIMLVLLSPQLLFGWSEGGHHAIGILAFRRMSPEKQQKFISIIKQHPNFEKDFKIPKNVADAGDDPIYLAGRACYWPDLARSYKEFDRPTWHYQLGPSFVLGDRTKLAIPETPGRLPPKATLDTQELYIEQALELCWNVMRYDAKDDSDKAIALCWIGNLVGDYHQPCHTGSLYCEQFPTKDGDRGANSIETKQSNNLHAVWDGLLGQRYDHADIKRRALEIEKYTTSDSASQRKFSDWRNDAEMRSKVYTDEVINWVQGSRTEPLELSEAYLQSARVCAQFRAMRAGQRLAVMWSNSL